MITTSLPKLPPGVLEKGELRIDGSGFARIQQCWTMAWYELAHRRVLDYRDSARGFGTALHAARQVQRQGWGHGPYDKACQKAMEKAIDSEFAGVELEEGEYRTAGRAKELIGLYLQRYPEENFDVVASELSAEKVLGEVVWTHSVGGARTCTVIWQGRTDEIARDRVSGKAVILDLKTAQEAYLDHEVNTYKMSVTLPMYCWLFSGERFGQFGEINDAVIDLAICRKPLQRPTAKSAPRNEFYRMTFTYSPARINEVKRNVLTVLGAWLTACGHHSEPPPMTGAPAECHRYKRPCAFLQVCEQATLKRRLAWLYGSAEFKDNEWNPMAKPERKVTMAVPEITGEHAPMTTLPANY